MALDPAKLLLSLRKKLVLVADAKRAPQMQAYMKSAMPYHGVPKPVLDRICRDHFRDLEFASFAEWQKAVLHFWKKAEKREEWYAALALLAHKSARAFRTPKAIALYEKLIVAGAWWDVVDEIASHHVGHLMRTYPRETKAALRSWVRSENMWKRRTAIICQIGSKGETDLAFLEKAIAPSIDSNEFFLRKAIGWALRSYAWVDLKYVERYVRSHPQLSPLSVREALKNAAALRSR